MVRPGWLSSSCEMFWNADTTLTELPSRDCACTTAEPPSGSCARVTLGGTSGTVTSTRIFPSRAGFTWLRVASWAACGAVSTTMVPCSAAVMRSAPVARWWPPLALISSAAAAALAASREPMMMG